MSKLAKWSCTGFDVLGRVPLPNVPRVLPPLPWERRLQESTLLSGNGKEGTLLHAQVRTWWGKPEILAGKSNSSICFVWKASVQKTLMYVVDWGDAFFILLLAAWLYFLGRPSATSSILISECLCRKFSATFSPFQRFNGAFWLSFGKSELMLTSAPLSSLLFLDRTHLKPCSLRSRRLCTSLCLRDLSQF